eukprot:3494025-Rhodomonas_salina.1
MFRHEAVNTRTGAKAAQRTPSGWLRTHTAIVLLLSLSAVIVMLASSGAPAQQGYVLPHTIRDPFPPFFSSLADLQLIFHRKGHLIQLLDSNHLSCAGAEVLKCGVQKSSRDRQSQ